MEENSLAWQRITLKSELYRRRVHWTGVSGYRAYCAICKKSFKEDEAEMHEVLLTRGSVRGNQELKPEIMVRYNCVLVHPKCHRRATTEDGKHKCISHLLVHEDAREIAAWLGHMQSLMKTNTPEVALNLVIEVLNENLSSMSEELRAAFAGGREEVPE